MQLACNIFFFFEKEVCTWRLHTPCSRPTSVNVNAKGFVRKGTDCEFFTQNNNKTREQQCNLASPATLPTWYKSYKCIMRIRHNLGLFVIKMKFHKILWQAHQLHPLMCLPQEHYMHIRAHAWHILASSLQMIACLFYLELDNWVKYFEKSDYSIGVRAITNFFANKME